MAIKNKGKTKQRSVARGPRHDPVPVPVPFVRRRWVQLVSMFIVGVLALAGVLWAWNGFQGYREDDRSAQELASRQRALGQWKAVVEAQVTAVGQLQGDAPPVVASDVSAAVDALGKGNDPSATAASLSSSAKELGRVAKAIDDFDLATTISNQGFDAQGSTALTSSKTELVQAFRQYEQAANLVVLAMAAKGKTRADLIDTAKAAEDSAVQLLQAGWIKYSSTLSENQLSAGGTPSGFGSGIPGSGG
jgi:hypothetical protein